MTVREAVYSVNLSPEEASWLRKISREEHLPESALLKKLVLDGLERLRLERACTAYARGEADLTGAARYAGISVTQMMEELERRGISYSPSFDDFLDGLESLLDTFGDDEATRRVIARFRAQPPD
jgi:predicted HTH domain antitoxin